VVLALPSWDDYRRIALEDDQAKTSMIAAGVSCRVLAGPGLPCGSAKSPHDLHRFPHTICTRLTGTACKYHGLPASWVTERSMARSGPRGDTRDEGLAAASA
jgi:hypothetical protein